MKDISDSDESGQESDDDTKHKISRTGPDKCPEKSPPDKKFMESDKFQNNGPLKLTNGGPHSEQDDLSHCVPEKTEIGLSNKLKEMVRDDHSNAEEKKETLEKSESQLKENVSKEILFKEGVRDNSKVSSSLKRLMRMDDYLPSINDYLPSPKKVSKVNGVPSNKTSVIVSSVTSRTNSLPKNTDHMNKNSPSHAGVSSYLKRSMPFVQNYFTGGEDQPLDLSKKTVSKSLTCPKSSITSPKVSNGYLPSVPSSLKCLQQQFGEDYHFRTAKKHNLYSASSSIVNMRPSVRSRNPSNTVPISMNSTEFFNHKSRCDSPGAISPSKAASICNLSPSSPHPKSPDYVLSKKQSLSDSKLNVSDSEAKESIKMEECMSDKTDNSGHKYTTHRCSCHKSYNTLYGLSIHLKDTGHMPASSKSSNLLEYPKLVRGQDMWLNQESEQTRRILRCMQCGESFRSLPMLTVHMMQTQHYTKIVSSDHGRRSHKCSAYCDRELDKECIFKCKVCNDTFTDMEGLANHMILSGHHKKQSIRGQSYLDIGLRTRRKRFYSGEENLQYGPSPTVATLLEYKRKCFNNSDYVKIPSSSHGDNDSKFSDEVESSVTCDNCGKRIETRKFVEHVRLCLHQKMDVLESLRLRFSDKLPKCKSPEIKVENIIPESQQLQRSEPDTKPLNFSKSPHQDTMCQEKKIKIKSEDLDKREEKIREKIDFLSQKVMEDPAEVNENMSKESKKALDIIDPEAGEDAPTNGSALKAMESFINKSFTSKFDFRTLASSSISENNISNSLPLNTSLSQLDRESPFHYFAAKYRKFYNAMSSNSKSPPPRVCTEDKEKLPTISPVSRPHKEPESPLSSSHGRGSPVVEEEDPGLDKKSDDTASNASEPLMNKYLNIDEEERENGRIKKKDSSSALDSLSSFVYGQRLTSEHPLDSLQKLITKNDIPKLVMEKALNCLQRESPDLSVPLNLSIKAEGSDDREGTYLGREDFSDSDTSPVGSDSDTADYRCAACSRQFASKGSYRYHLSRCHLSSVKKYGIKEAFNMSPYVYLPLDHTAKFSKYYEMAHELASKGK